MNGSLLDYLHKCGAQLTAKGNVTLLIQMAAQCADGMAYLEKEVSGTCLTFNLGFDFKF